MAQKKPGQRGYKPRFNKQPKGQPNADMFPYDNALPCKNPKCKSHGKPHPNCKCYGSAKSFPQRRLEGLAEGGEVGRFCDTCQDHLPDCEYYAGGGDVAPSWDSLSAAPPGDSAPSWDSLSSEPPESAPNWDDLQTPEQHYGSTEQEVKTGLEGLAQGVAGPLATLAETKLLGVKPEDIAGRAAANPVIHGASEATGLVGSMATGLGEGAVAAKIGAKLAPEVLGKIGGSVISGFITNGIIQGGDEISKGILGTGDPQAPVSAALAHMGAAGLFGGAFGGAGAVLGKGLEAVGAAKLGTMAASLLAGVADGHAEAMGVPLPKVTDGGQNAQIYQAGISIAQQLPEKLVQASEAIGLTAGASVIPGLGGVVLGKTIGKMIQRPLQWVSNKYLLPVAIKVLSSGEPAGLWDALDYAGDVSKGAQKINRGVTSLFQSGSQQIVDEASEKDQEKIKKYVSQGVLNQEIQNQNAQDSQIQTYAEGGEVGKPLPAPPVLEGAGTLAKHFPAQNVLFQAAKGRVNNYLNSLRPQENQQRLPFDKPMKNAEADRNYNRAVALAAQPLSILNHVAGGTLTPEALGHFTQLFPELHGELSKAMTKKVTELQLKDETIPYRLRQSMSLFLGSPLDSTLTPQAMQAAQSVYAQPAGGGQSQPAQETQPKKNKSALSRVGSDAYTADQAAAKRQATIRP